MRRLILPALAALTLAGCATTPTLYQPAAGPRSVGYAEQRIEPGRYRVTFQGGPGAPAAYVADLALRRAAELTLAEGYDWFRVSGPPILEGRPDRGPRIGLGVGSASFGRHSALGLSTGTSFSLGGGDSVTATLEVFMGKGARPPGADVYDARGVRDTLGRRI